MVLTRTRNDLKILFQSVAIVRKGAIGREKYHENHVCPETTPIGLGLRTCSFLQNFHKLSGCKKSKIDFEFLSQLDARSEK